MFEVVTLTTTRVAFYTFSPSQWAVWHDWVFSGFSNGLCGAPASMFIVTVEQLLRS
jgi:hypothetical protein